MTGLPSAPAFGTAMLPADTFANDVVLIAGADQLLSIAAAIEFARAGAKVALWYGADSAAADNAELRALNADYRTMAVNLLDESAIATAFDRVENELGPVSIVLCNPPLPQTQPVENLTLKLWRDVTQSIADSVFLCCTEFARRCIRSQRSGAVLNVIETMAWQGGPGTAHAAAAEAAVLNLSKTLAIEWGPDDIRVNAVAVAAFAGDDTPAARQAVRESRDLARTLPAMRLGQPHEFGWAATMLCSPYAAYTTGETFIIDGGSHLRRGMTGPAFKPVRDWAGE
jgi:NAD(P)-dependent dehydrogenase (short-subunit alcohol dehydrogenase family)